MGFIYQKVEELHRKSGEKAIDFSRAIFGPKSKLGLQYFNGKDSISTKHLERLSRHFNVPLSYFFDDSCVMVTHIGNVVKENKIGVGNLNTNQDVKNLEETIKHLRETIADKNEQIQWLRGQLDAMVKSIGTSQN